MYACKYEFVEISIYTHICIYEIKYIIYTPENNHIVILSSIYGNVRMQYLNNIIDNLYI